MAYYSIKQQNWLQFLRAGRFLLYIFNGAIISQNNRIGNSTNVLIANKIKNNAPHNEYKKHWID